MKSGATVCFVLAAISTFVAVKNVFIDGANRPEGIENLVGYAVGAFLLPIAFLIGGLVLLEKSKRNVDDSKHSDGKD